MKNYNYAIVKAVLMLGVALGMGQSALAGNILIINGSSITTESTTTSEITSNLNNVLMNAGHTTTIADGTPLSFSGYSQVWDLRFSNAGALTGTEQSQYLSFLQAGGGIFLMGENSFFMQRNDSILSLIAMAGGGTIQFTEVDSTQTVQAPFNGPNVIGDGTVSYAWAGGFDSAGTGSFITETGGIGTGVAFGVGDLANATAGALSAILDVNFMQGIYDQPDSQQLLMNLAGFVANEVEPPADVPEPVSMALFGLGLAGLQVTRRRAGSRA